MGVLDKLFNKHNISNSLARDITKPIQQFGTKTAFNRAFYRPYMVHQIDLLYLPQDEDGNKYLAVVVDIGSGICDARQLKTRDAATVLRAVQDIYRKKKYLSEPLRLQVDAGSEFSELIKYFRARNVGVRIAATGRHSQQAVVENMNKTIGSAILKLQLNNELITGQLDKNWTSYLPDIIKLINEHAKATKKNIQEEDDEGDFKCEGTECEILNEGDLVRVRLDYPKNIEGNRLHGNFRAGDYRWSLKPHKIEKVLLFPNQPIRYVVEGYKNNTFAKWELMPYSKPTEMRMTDNQYIVEKLIKRTKQKGVDGFIVKWAGYDDSENSFVARKELMRNNTQQVKDYDAAK